MNIPQENSSIVLEEGRAEHLNDSGLEIKSSFLTHIEVVLSVGRLLFEVTTGPDPFHLVALLFQGCCAHTCGPRWHTACLQPREWQGQGKAHFPLKDTAAS